MQRILGRSGIAVSAVGMGCWAIGGVWTYNGRPAGWGEVDDAESIRAIHAALDMGVTLFDTAANYGCGSSERILGQAIKGRRDKVIIATKFADDVDEAGKNAAPYNGDGETGPIAEHLREDCEASLQRLDTDYIDLYQLHAGGYDVEKSAEIRLVLEELVAEGKIRTYGWSTDRIAAIRAFAQGPNCSAVQQQLNIFTGDLDLLHLCDELNLASLNRAPLGMGILTGKFSPATRFTNDDVRSVAGDWFPGFAGSGVNPQWLDQLEAVREILTSDGRTLAQGALAWLWGASSRTVPIPGFRNVQQVNDNAGAMAKGALTAAQMAEINKITGR